MGGTGFEKNVESSGICGSGRQGNVNANVSRLDSGPSDPDLNRLIAAWSTLPDVTRRRILALLDAATAPADTADDATSEGV